jgi:hypothetical protein
MTDLVKINYTKEIKKSLNDAQCDLLKILLIKKEIE